MHIPLSRVFWSALALLFCIHSIGCRGSDAVGDGWTVGGEDAHQEADSRPNGDTTVDVFDIADTRDARSVRANRFRELVLGVAAYGACGVDRAGGLHCGGDLKRVEGQFAGVEVDEFDTYGNRVCTTTISNELLCADADEEDSASPPQGPATDVALGLDYGCVIRPDRTIDCWGKDPNGWGVLDAPTGVFSAISATDKHVCAVARDGTVECWGAPNFGAAANPRRDSFVQIDVARWTNCGVLEDRSIHCWGLGTDEGEKEAPPDFDQGVPPKGDFRAVDGGTSHTCGLKVSGELECWGLGSDPERDEHPNDSNQAVPPEGTYQAVDSAGHASCAIRKDGAAVCWGAGFDGHETFRPDSL